MPLVFACQKGMYRKELFSVYPDVTAETGGAAGGKMAFSRGFAVYPRLADTKNLMIAAANLPLAVLGPPS
jgi:hypothetical protein